MTRFVQKEKPVKVTGMIERQFIETLALACRVKSYIQNKQRADFALLHDDLRLTAVSESLRMSNRMTQSLAWLICRRAVMEEAAEIFFDRLEEIAEPPAQELFALLPQTLQTLSQESLEVYLRIQRLDRLLENT